MGWFHFSRKQRAAARGFGRQQPIEPNPLQAFILEPILTPSGLVDAPDHSPSVMDLVTHPVTDVHPVGDDVSPVPDYSHTDTTAHPATDTSGSQAETTDHQLVLSGSGYGSAQDISTEQVASGNGYGDTGTTPIETPVTPTPTPGEDPSTAPEVHQPTTPTLTIPTLTTTVAPPVAEQSAANSTSADAAGSEATPSTVSQQPLVDVANTNLTTFNSPGNSNLITLGNDEVNANHDSLPQPELGNDYGTGTLEGMPVLSQVPPPVHTTPPVDAVPGMESTSDFSDQVEFSHLTNDHPPLPPIVEEMSVTIGSGVAPQVADSDLGDQAIDNSEPLATGVGTTGSEAETGLGMISLVAAIDLTKSTHPETTEAETAIPTSSGDDSGLIPIAWVTAAEMTPDAPPIEAKAESTEAGSDSTSGDTPGSTPSELMNPDLTGNQPMSSEASDPAEGDSGSGLDGSGSESTVGNADGSTGDGLNGDGTTEDESGSEPTPSETAGNSTDGDADSDVGNDSTVDSEEGSDPTDGSSDGSPSTSGEGNGDDLVGSGYGEDSTPGSGDGSASGGGYGGESSGGDEGLTPAEVFAAWKIDYSPFDQVPTPNTPTAGEDPFSDPDASDGHSSVGDPPSPAPHPEPTEPPPLSYPPPTQRQMDENTSEYLGTWDAIYDRFEDLPYGTRGFYRPTTETWGPFNQVLSYTFLPDFYWAAYYEAYYQQDPPGAPPDEPGGAPPAPGPGTSPPDPNQPTLTYLERLESLLDQANGQLLGIKQTVLTGAKETLLAVGKLVEQGGLYDAMGVLSGAFNTAEDVKTKYGIKTASASLYWQIRENIESVKAETLAAKVIAAAAQVPSLQDHVRTDGYFAKSLADLGRTYASLRPQLDPTVIGTEQSCFLNDLCLAQDEPTILAAASRLEQELQGVEDPARTLRFIGNLLEAAKWVPALKEQVRDGKFIRELVNLALAYAKTNPRTPEEPLQCFLNTLWQASDAIYYQGQVEHWLKAQTQQAARELRDFLQEFDTDTKREKVLEFTTNLLKAANLLHGDGLDAQKQDPVFLDALIGLGGAYAAIDPQIVDTVEEPQSFLDKLYRASSNTLVQEGTTSLENFLEGIKNPITLLKYSYDVLRSAKFSPTSQELFDQSSNISTLLNLGGFLTYLLEGKLPLITDNGLEYFQSLNKEISPTSSGTTLEPNPDCNPGDTEVPISRARLEELGYFRGLGKSGRPGSFSQELGDRFEEVVLMSADVPKYTGKSIRTIERAIATLLRDLYKEEPKIFEGTAPDALTDIVHLRVTEKGVQRFVLMNSAVIEVKSSGSNIYESSYDYQPLGLLEIAEESIAGKARLIPRITYYTPNGVQISNAYRIEAQKRGVAIWQSVVHELCDKPGVLRNGPTVPLNKNLYIQRGIAPVNELGRFPIKF